MRQLKDSVLKFSSHQEMQEYVNSNTGFHLEGRQISQNEFLAQPIIDIQYEQINQNENIIYTENAGSGSVLPTPTTAPDSGDRPL